MLHLCCQQHWSSSLSSLKRTSFCWRSFLSSLSHLPGLSCQSFLSCLPCLPCLSLCPFYSFCPVCPVCPVCRNVLHCELSNVSSNGQPEKMQNCKGSWLLYTSKPEVVWSLIFSNLLVEGYMTTCIAASITLNSQSWVTYGGRTKCQPDKMPTGHNANQRLAFCPYFFLWLAFCPSQLFGWHFVRTISTCFGIFSKSWKSYSKSHFIK